MKRSWFANHKKNRDSSSDSRTPISKLSFRNHNIKLLLLIILTAGCNSNKEKSDAYGVFETEAVIIAAESPGKVIEIFANEGEQITAGDLLAITDTTQLMLKLQQLEAQKDAVNSGKESVTAQIAVFEEQKQNLLLNHKRINALLEDGAATQKQLDDLHAEIKITDKQIASTNTRFSQINNELKVLEAQKQISQDQLLRSKITAPLTGIVLEKYIEQGELAIQGKPLFKIANLDQLILKVYVSGTQLPNIEPGQEVEVLIDKSETENKSMTGIITWISSEAEFTPKIIQTKEERVKLVYAIKVVVKNDGTLKIGMPGEINFNIPN
ncbi:MAG TPA: HlyD family efflux transporter periplasmic adaptor subunit [Mariniphaga sp.]|nr:HlyD family efflux transporter periplasmic adaptor subunit [Mariniphaga sp.]